MGGIAMWEMELQTEDKPDGSPKAVNPKDKFGNKKVSLSKLPAAAVAWGAAAMMDGAGKYGPYNWRDNPVIASIYVDAARRHLDLWFEGQRAAEDSGVHHLGHVIACAAILLDAELNQRLQDDRPRPAPLQPLYDELMQVIEKMRAAHENIKP